MIQTAEELMTDAIQTFRVGLPGKPELVPTGFSAVDNVIGGLDPKSCGVLASQTGLGKSRAMLAAIINSQCKVGLVSTEDPGPVLGSRLLAAFSGVNSLVMRRGDYSPAQEAALLEAAKHRLPNVMFGIEVAEGIERVEDSIAELCEAGCRMIWVDYIQKIRGHNADRRNEVADTFNRIQRAVSRGNAAGMVISQIRRLQDYTKPPQIFHLKETGELENEARVILMGHKVMDNDLNEYVRFRIAKSTFGGENVEWDMKQAPSGVLEELDHMVKEVPW